MKIKTTPKRRTHFFTHMSIPFQLVAVSFAVNSFLSFAAERSLSQETRETMYRADSEIRRLTYSGDHWVGYPSISDDGTMIVFQEEIRDTSTVAGEARVKRIIRAIKSDGTDPRIVFADSMVYAPPPFEDSYLLVGTKPPLISGNGRKVLFALSLSAPANLKDHYMGIINVNGTGFHTIEFKNEALSSTDWKKERFKSDTWERVANYAISGDGSTIASVAKGHFGPVASGSPSGILIVNADGTRQRTLIAPKFKDSQWTWSTFPRKPLSGGGWAFALSGDGRTILFGAQSSEENSDYDLYTMGIDGTNPRRVTSFRDRLFSFADISDDGSQITFFYAGRKGDGIGTYVMNSDGTGLQRLTSSSVKRVDYDDVTRPGDKVIFKAPSGGFALDVIQSQEVLLFGRFTPGYIRSGLEMDFPSYPSFWAPNLISADGKIVLLMGVPVGKDLSELYVLEVKDFKKALLICPACRNRMDPSFRYCPYDGTKLEQN